MFLWAVIFLGKNGNKSNKKKAARVLPPGAAEKRRM
jgi:hypothetical protein